MGITPFPTPMLVQFHIKAPDSHSHTMPNPLNMAHPSMKSIENDSIQSLISSPFISQHYQPTWPHCWNIEMDGIEYLPKMSLHSNCMCCVTFSYLFNIQVKSLHKIISECREGNQLWERKVIKKSFSRAVISKMGTREELDISNP